MTNTVALNLRVCANSSFIYRVASFKKLYVRMCVNGNNTFYKNEKFLMICF